MTTEVQYVHLQVHSEFSIEDSLLTVNDIAGLAKKDEMPAVAITDVGNVFSLVKFYQAAVKNKVKPIIGAEVRIKEAEEGEDGKQTSKGSGVRKGVETRKGREGEQDRRHRPQRICRRHQER